MVSDGYRRGYVSFAHFLLYLSEYLLEIYEGKQTFGGIENYFNAPSRGSIFCSIHDGLVRFEYRTLKTGIRYKPRTGTHPQCRPRSDYS